MVCTGRAADTDVNKVLISIKPEIIFKYRFLASDLIM